MDGSPGDGLRRNLGPLDVLALSIGSVIGTGIFFLPGKVAAAMGPAAIVAYGVSSVLCLLGTPDAKGLFHKAMAFSGAETFGPHIDQLELITFQQ